MNRIATGKKQENNPGKPAEAIYCTHADLHRNPQRIQQRSARRAEDFKEYMEKHEEEQWVAIRKKYSCESDNTANKRDDANTIGEKFARMATRERDQGELLKDEAKKNLCLTFSSRCNANFKDAQRINKHLTDMTRLTSERRDQLEGDTDNENDTIDGLFRDKQSDEALAGRAAQEQLWKFRAHKNDLDIACKNIGAVVA
jgi:hypothetical protein